ncbi:MAG TPA: hypothetical protein VK463_06890 [Desulfomonilaceae bacterium]|nr:hypothetical protein [Desulfomonilaceae bacterium]
MVERRIDEVIQTVDALVQVEKTVGEFYGSCSEVFTQDSEFWLKLARDEFLHADVLVKLHEMITRKPHKFGPGKPFPIAALRTFIAQVDSERAKLMAGTLTMYDALVAAHHIERTIIEYKYLEVIKTEKSEYLEALDNLAVATAEHRKRIKKKMDEYRKSLSMQ